MLQTAEVDYAIHAYAVSIPRQARALYDAGLRTGAPPALVSATPAETGLREALGTIRDLANGTNLSDRNISLIFDIASAALESPREER